MQGWLHEVLCAAFACIHYCVPLTHQSVCVLLTAIGLSCRDLAQRQAAELSRQLRELSAQMQTVLSTVVALGTDGSGGGGGGGGGGGVDLGGGGGDDVNVSYSSAMHSSFVTGERGGGGQFGHPHTHTL